MILYNVQTPLESGHLHHYRPILWHSRRPVMKGNFPRGLRAQTMLQRGTAASHNELGQGLTLNEDCLLGFGIALNPWPLFPFNFTLLEREYLSYACSNIRFWKQITCLVSQVYRYRDHFATRCIIPQISYITDLYNEILDFQLIIFFYLEVMLEWLGLWVMLGWGKCILQVRKT